MEFVRNKELLYRLVLADGLPRSGKSMLSNILTGYESIEKIEYYQFLEYISLAYHNNKISNDMAKTILRTQMDSALFDQMIGRNINTRPDDYSGINNYHTPEKYINRQDIETSPNPEFHGNPHGSSIADRVLKEKPVCLSFTHNALSRSKIIFESFKNKVLFVYLNRRPIDLIYEWNRKNFGTQLGIDPTDTTYWIEYKGTSMPIFAKGWESEYRDMKPLDRIVKMVLTSFRENLEGFERSENKNQIKIINFEELVSDPKKQVDNISKFLNLKTLNFMSNILEQEKCPRTLNDKEYSDRKTSVFKNISKKYLICLEELDEIHSKLLKNSYLDIL